jgi:DNA-binding transcriptional LysR family regulator
MDEFLKIRTLVQVVEAGSFSAAARQTDMSISAIARQVKALEESLGVRLLNRTTRNQALTEAGALFYERARAILDDVERAKRDASSFQKAVKGVLRVSLRVSAGTTVIVPALPRFLERHPELTVNVSLSDERFDLVARGVDVAVWLGHLGDTGVVARRLTPTRRVVCGSPEYFRKNGTPGRPTDLASHNCILFTVNQYGRAWRFSKDDRRVDIPVSGNLESSHAQVLMSAALAGVGLVLVPDWMARGPINDGRLQTVLADYEISPTDYDAALYAVYPHSRGLSPKARAFVDFLVDLFRNRTGQANAPLATSPP